MAQETLTIKKVTTKKLSEYGSQLLEKQKLRNHYGLREKQFRRYFREASKQKGQTGKALLNLLERRLDNLVFLSGFAQTRSQARQLITHRHFSLNDKRVSIPSILVSKGDEIKLVGKFNPEKRPDLVKAKWFTVDRKSKSIKVNDEPEKTNEIPVEEFDTNKIIEFYSR